MPLPRIRWMIVALVVLLATPAPLLAMQPTPNAPEGTTLYINHGSRLIAWLSRDGDQILYIEQHDQRRGTYIARPDASAERASVRPIHWGLHHRELRLPTP